MCIYIYIYIYTHKTHSSNAEVDSVEAPSVDPLGVHRRSVLVCVSISINISLRNRARTRIIVCSSVGIVSTRGTISRPSKHRHDRNTYPIYVRGKESENRTHDSPPNCTELFSHVACCFVGVCFVGLFWANSICTIKTGSSITERLAEYC